MTTVHIVDTADDPPAAETPKTILFLHGLGGSAEGWRPQYEALRGEARCLAWTMPGYGSSPPLADLTIASLAAAATTELTERGVERAIIVGHSMGGYIAQEMALTTPTMVEGLILVATTAAFGKPGSSFNDEFLAARLRPLDDGRHPAELAPAVVDQLVTVQADEHVRATAIASMSQIEPDAYRRALAALVAWDGRDRLGTIDTPTLCIAGDADTTAPVGAMERLSGLIAGSRLEVVADSGHLINLEQPERFNRLVIDFVREG